MLQIVKYIKWNFITIISEIIVTCFGMYRKTITKFHHINTATIAASRKII